MEITVLHNQSLFDVAIQHTGNVMNAFEIAKENSLSVTDYLVSGYKLIIPNGVPFNRDVFDYYNSKKIQPATGTTEGTADGEQELEGIGYWIIEKNFRVS